MLVKVEWGDGEMVEWGRSSCSVGASEGGGDRVRWWNRAVVVGV